MRIPRCRATVSEDKATGHWAKAWEGRLRKPGVKRPYSPSQETARTVNIQPFRMEEE